MKNTLKTLTTIILAFGLVTPALAQRANIGRFTKGSFKAATSQQEIQTLKKGDQYAKVCMKCKSITIKEVTDAKEVEKLCHDGGTVHCDSCEEQITIKRTKLNPTGKGNPVKSKKSSVTYVNADGEECMFIVPIKSE